MKRLAVWFFSIMAAFNFSLAFALNLDKVKVNFLSGDYKAAILEGEKMLAAQEQSPNIDELYYILGLSYLKDSNYLRASDIFEIILREFNNSSFKEEAKLGLGDTYFLRGELDKAQSIYEDLLGSSQNLELKARLYHRLSQVAFKKDDAGTGKEYLSKLKQEFPQNIESRLNKDLDAISGFAPGFYYTVQVGSFSSGVNAGNFTQKLIQQGYPAYIEEITEPGKDKMYRVKVGKLGNRQEAVSLEKKLSREGYPTKICP